MPDSFIEFVEASEPPRDDSWQIHDDNQADWAIMKIAAAEAMVAQKKLEREKAIEKWDAYVEKATRQALADRMFFEGKLHGYLLRLRESGKLGKKKSWSLPNGTINLRHLRPKFKVVDADAFLAWCAAHDLTEIVVQAQETEAKKHFVVGTDNATVWAIFEDTTELQWVPGVVIERLEGDSFSVKLDDEKEGAV